ncbi:MAG TPA: porphobilinogen synthase [Candidatus Obscuribacterales bacterium]
MAVVSRTGTGKNFQTEWRMKEGKTEAREDLALDSLLPENPMRLRRLRATPALRSMVRETHLRLDQLIYPFFIIEGSGKRNPIGSMPGIHQQTVDNVLREAEQALEAGIRAVLLFGIPEQKDGEATGAWHRDGIVQKAMRELKKRLPELVLIADLCLCEYTDHGHCGIVADGKVLNDPTLALLARTALAQAEAGADIIAPSDMMDLRVGVIRKALDANGFQHLPIMSYAAKFASALYGPFREAAESAPKFGDRTSYQMDPANAREALREIELDIQEGADIVMVKPALSYLDIIRQARDLTKLPIAAYNVSGEYSMVKAAALNGWIDERRVVLETLTGVVRAGADLIITYHAREIANWLKQ